MDVDVVYVNEWMNEYADSLAGKEVGRGGTWGKGVNER